MLLKKYPGDRSRGFLCGGTLVRLAMSDGKVGARLLVTGWGAIDPEDGDQPDKPMKIAVPRGGGLAKNA